MRLACWCLTRVDCLLMSLAGSLAFAKLRLDKIESLPLILCHKYICTFVKQDALLKKYLSSSLLLKINRIRFMCQSAFSKNHNFHNKFCVSNRIFPIKS